jgi:hypothetical protein
MGQGQYIRLRVWVRVSVLRLTLLVDRRLLLYLHFVHGESACLV